MVIGHPRRLDVIECGSMVAGDEVHSIVSMASRKQSDPLHRIFNKTIDREMRIAHGSRNRVHLLPRSECLIHASPNVLNAAAMPWSILATAFSCISFLAISSPVFWFNSCPIHLPWRCLCFGFRSQMM